MTTRRRRILGWYAFDWASQPYNTLILTFIFAPYFTIVIGDAVRAQELWADALTLAGLATAGLAPVIGALADRSGRLVRWVARLSIIYVLACTALWWAAPGGLHVGLVLLVFVLGLIAAELATIITNAMLPGLASRAEIGRISGNGFAIGYAGGLIALLLMLGFFAQNAEGTTFLGRPPAFGLEAATHEGTRAVGPFCALWFMISMLPFFAWVRDPVREAPDMSLGEAARGSVADLRDMLGRAVGRPSLIAFLAASTCYRDALNGLYAFGGIYAIGVLHWSVTTVGLFGVLGAGTAGLASWAGGHLDDRFGPKPVITGCVLVLTAVSCLLVGLDRDSLFGMALPATSRLPDILMFGCGAVIGGVGGAVQSASRSMMVRHAEPDHPTEAFALYALTGKASAFLAPLLIGIATNFTGSQRAGVSPLILLFLMGLALLVLVKKNGDT